MVEAPIIDKVEVSGIKAEKIKKELFKIIKLKSRSSYNDFLASKDRDVVKEYLKQLGYYFATVETVVQSLENNLVYIEHSIDLGEKAKIKKISFIGDKIFKDNKLRSLIVSEEYKFWKIISGKKYLNEQIINLDKKLLKNFYLNKGFYNVEINTSFAKLINNEEEFELIFNISAKEKVFFNDITLNIPKDFDKNNFTNLNNLFDEIKGKPYSINAVDKILDEIDRVTLIEEYKSIEASVDESLIKNELNLVFNIVETEKFFDLFYVNLVYLNYLDLI